MFACLDILVGYIACYEMLGMMLESEWMSWIDVMDEWWIDDARICEIFGLGWLALTISR